MHTKTLTELSQLLADKTISSTELTQHYLDRIKAHNPTLNAYIAVTEAQALAQAKAADDLRAKGDATALTGIPIAQKDIFCTQGVKTTCGSKMLENFTPPYDATVISNFAEAGAVMLGKTNMDEFAMGSSNENSFFGDVKNPWNLNTVPGGSSGGSAAAVAGALCAGSTGTDTGGSIRQPAAFCGITGLKPTYGRVSRWGMVAFASSLDQGGPFARTAQDCALMLQAMAGFDPKDSTSIDTPVPDYSASLNQDLKGLKIGVPKEYFQEGLEPAVETVVQAAIKDYEKLGATMVPISLPNVGLSVPAYYVVAPAECSSNLSRFDGVRYGHRCEDPKNLTDLYERSRSEGFGDEVKRRILIGTYALSAGYYDAYYLKAQKLRRLIANDFKAAFESVDLIIGPTSPCTAFELGSMMNDPLRMYASDIYTIAVNLAGLPGISVPAGLVDGMPVGLQLIANHFEEARLLNAAHQYQMATDWHCQLPAFESAE